MVENKVVLEWALELGKQAITEARSGNTAMLNRLGGNSALKLFIDNVCGTNAVKADQFAAYYAPQWAEIRRLHEEYLRQEQVTEAVDKVSALEAKFDALAAQLTAFIESQQVKPEAEAEDKPAKKAKKAAKVEEAIEEPETEATEEGADGESEA